MSNHDEAVRLAEKHGGVFGHGSEKVYIFGEPEIAALVAEVRRDDLIEKYEALEPALEQLLEYCENVGHGCVDEAIAAGAALERLHRARVALAHASPTGNSQEVGNG